jgi:hypothetical protein
MASILPKKNRSSFDAKGAVEVPPGFDKEDGEIGSSIGSVIPDVPELSSRWLKLRVFNTMAKTDVTSSVSIRVVNAPILGATFYVDPVDDDEKNIDISQFVEDNIFRLTSTPWLPTLGKILRMNRDGNSILETCYINQDWRPHRKNANSKQYTMLRKLAYRPATTIQEIERDSSGGPQVIVQNKVDETGKITKVEIPIEKAAIFVIGDTDDFYGESLLRSAFEHWHYKKYLYKIDAIQKERHSLGVPRGSLPPNASKTDKEILRKLLANIRTNEHAYIVQPFGYVIDFAEVHGNLVNALESASAHDTLILLNVMAQFMVLGLESAGSGGGRSTSAATLDIFYKSLWHIANLICDVINTYIIPKLVLYNFDVDQFPKLKVRAIGQSRDLQQIAAGMANVFDKSIITPDLPTENWARELFDMPRKLGDRQTPVNNSSSTPVGNGSGKAANVSKEVKGQGNMGRSPADA